MHFSQSTVLALVAALSQVSAHGVITSIQGANGVTMPGLSVIDGTPRDCSTPGCGSEADTSIIRQNGGPLGRTRGGGTVQAAPAIAAFLGTAAPATAATTSTDNVQGIGGRRARRNRQNQEAAQNEARGLLGDLLGGLLGNKGQGAGAGNGNNAGATESAGTKTPPGTVENGVAAAAGKGATSGLPTPDASGIITMTLHQVNQDGAGPFAAAIDPTSGGTDESAFQTAQVLQDVPGIGVGGLSGARATDFVVKVQMPAGMKCTGSVGGATNVCIVRMKNQALAGPFGGSAAFTNPDSTAATTSTSTGTTGTAGTAGTASSAAAAASTPQSTVLSNSPAAGQTTSISNNGQSSSTTTTSSNAGTGADSSTISQTNGGNTATTQSEGGDITATNNGRKRGLEFSA